uniref:Proteasome subunit alpha type n=1 Tax=Aureoumbra lagunensis TaxID=44058 RepID=A0A7S3NR86_9STRA|mmetsp:Transcript_23422/g.30407  ORF Transcript_23422/g.30407 Transcript_23422/m.30407 type:complete len:254 (-) Transcript_23422:234-995(-)
MSRRYDKVVTTFSPEGRLHQVEYAVEAINNAGAAVGILAKDGVVLGGEKQKMTKLLQAPKSSEKIYKIDDHIATIVAGLTSDANILIDEARLAAQRYDYAYDNPIPVEQLVQRVCNHKQLYTQYGGQRPFGVKFLFAGYDSHLGFQIYVSDPSGTYSGWKATSLGQNANAGQSLLKQEYSPDLNLEQSTFLALKVLDKTMESVTSDNLDLFTLSLGENGQLIHTVFPPSKVNELVTKLKEEQAASGSAPMSDD